MQICGLASNNVLHQVRAALADVLAQGYWHLQERCLNNL
jgi:hypothetical protein